MVRAHGGWQVVSPGYLATECWAKLGCPPIECFTHGPFLGQEFSRSAELHAKGLIGGRDLKAAGIAVESLYT